MSDLSLNEYQRQSMRTAVPINDTFEWGFQLSGFGLGIAGEAGETADLIKKLVHHQHPYTEEFRSEIKRELGDTLWYIQAIADRCDFTLEEIAKFNIDKLKKRYPNGWTSEESINRDKD